MKIFSVDAETDGLYGPVWAIGAAVLDTEPGLVQVWGSQIDPDVVTDPWVREHVVPAVNLARVSSREQLLDEFWAFWMEHREGSVCVADFGAPVEAGLFRACVERDLPGRMWNGPYPLHEVGTALLMAGIDPDVDRREFADRLGLDQHNPVHDALASALCWQKACQQLAQTGAGLIP